MGMGKKHGITTESENGSLIPEDDFEYEKELAEEEQEKRSAEEQRYLEYIEAKKKKEKREREERDRRIAQDKIELMKLKSGVIEESEELKERHEEKRVLTGKEKIANIWYHDKMWICFGLFIAVVVTIMVVDVVTKVRPDLEIMMICDNNLQAEETKTLLEERIAKYTPDINGDGEVKVRIMNCALNEGSTNQIYVSNSQKFFANLQQGQIIMVITDSATDPEYQALMTDTLPEEIPGNPYIDEKGLSLDMAFLAKEIKYDAMPNDIHLCMRRPLTTVDDTIEEMEENYAQNLEIMKALANALAEEAEQCSDEGLPDPPSKDMPARSEEQDTAESSGISG